MNQTGSLREVSLTLSPSGGTSTLVLSQALGFPPRSPAQPSQEPTLLGWGPHILGFRCPSFPEGYPCSSASDTSWGAAQKHEEAPI